MSRSKTSMQSRADKSAKLNAPTPQIVQDIVPGKLNDNDWIKKEDGHEEENFAKDIMEDILGAALDVVFQKYIESLLIPYTVSKTKDSILKVIRWNFLSIDSGENDVHNNPSWFEDEEPVSLMIDTSAQGSNCVNVNMSRVMSPLLEECEETTSQTVVNNPDEPVKEMNDENFMEDSNLKLNIEPKMRPNKDTNSESLLKMKQSSKKKKLKTKEEEILSEVKEMYIENENLTKIPPKSFSEVCLPNSCHSIVKLQRGRPPGKKEIEIDEWGQVLSFNRIAPEKLPSHQIETSIHIIDPQFDNTLISQDTKNSQKRKNQSLKFRSSLTDSSRQSQMQKSFKEEYLSLSAVKPLPPPLLDRMDVAAGVVVYEGDRIKRGVKYPSNEVRYLQEKHNNTKNSSLKKYIFDEITVKDLLRNEVPMIRPLSRPTKTELPLY